MDPGFSPLFRSHLLSATTGFWCVRFALIYWCSTVSPLPPQQPPRYAFKQQVCI
jgi:hypothetical protein